MIKYLLCGSLLLLCGTLAAQLPQSNVYLFNLRQLTDSTFEFSRPRYLTAFNSNGYNNQPVFISNTEIYLTVQMPGMTQPDLYALNLQQRTKTRVTRTPAGEFSPARTPDYYKFSAIRQEITGADTVLRLWEFPIDRLSGGRPVFRNLTGMGYYTWLDSRRLALFMIGSPNYLGLASTDSDQVQPIATTVGRSFQKLPNGNLAYVQKANFGQWLLMEKNLFRPELQPQNIIATLPGSEDFVVLPDGTFIMGQGSKLYKFNRLRDRQWKEIADLRFYNIRSISRVALSQDLQLGIVAE